MSIDTFHHGWMAGLEAARTATDLLADQLEAAVTRADDAERRATQARADAAEHQMIAIAAQAALLQALSGSDN